MALSVEAALQLEAFSRISARVFAGHENLSREVRWVHPMEIPDIAQFLSGGEMLLTAGLGIGKTVSQQRRFIREISEAGAAALVIELSGRAFSTMPEPLVEEAHKLQFPLIGLDREVPFVEVSAQVHELTLKQVHTELLAFEELNAEFIHLLLESRSHVSFIESLTHRVGAPVVLENAEHAIIAYAGGSAQTDELISSWQVHARLGHRSVDPVGQFDRSSAAEDDGAPECSRRQVVLRGEVWGWVHVFHGSEPLVGVNAYAMERAADAIAITLVSDRESGARASQRQNSLISRLLLGDITGEQFVDRVLRVGRDLRRRPLVVVMFCKQPEDDNLEEALEKDLAQLDLPAVVADIGNFVMAVAGLSKQVSAEAVATHLDASSTRSGVSRGVPPSQISDAIRQAKAAASVAAAQEHPSAWHFDRLGVMRLLVELSQGPELARFVEDELGPVLEHDAAGANVLLPTLRAYLECDANKSRAAEMLFVQRRTLYYRLDRLGALLGKALEDPEARSSLRLALRALEFLEPGEATEIARSTGPPLHKPSKK